jgi:hypothetical protein
MNQLIRCINCHALFLRTAFDQAPDYGDPSVSRNAPESTGGMDDFSDFLSRHRGHRLEPLTILEDSSISDSPYIEPVKVSYFRATNGREDFVIRKSRKGIGEPLSYQFFPGDYSLSGLSVKIQEKAIQKQMARDFRQPPLPPRKVESFIRLCKDIARGVDPAALDRAPDVSTHPLEVFCRMDDMSLMCLLRNCRHLFDAEEYPAVERFVLNEKEDGALLLVATYRIDLVERRESQVGAFSAFPATERKKAKRRL